MNPVAPAMAVLGDRIADLSAQLGRRVDVDALGVASRRDELRLAQPGRWSPNGACRLIQAADGWIAVNLARDEDRDLAPAWLERDDVAADPWAAIEQEASKRRRDDLVGVAILLGLPVAAVGEVMFDRLEAPTHRLGRPSSKSPATAWKVVDLSALWAGPMCGAVLAAMGAEVTRIESLRRPDPTRISTPEFFRRLNSAKTELGLDLSRPDAQARLRQEIASAEVIITSARPRGLASLGLTADNLFRSNPALVWAAITGYGWSGPGAARVGFGDDAAAAGGLVSWTDGVPSFLGDALADPLTGLVAAAGTMKALAAGGGVLVDAALARCAAGAAALCDIGVAA